MAFKLTQDRSDTADYPNSYYHASRNRGPDTNPLDGSSRADVCVIGGGYTGLSTALHLSKNGYKVILLEARKVGWGASGRNGGQLGSGQRKKQIELEKLLGKTTARALWDLAQDAKAIARSLIADYEIDCDLKPGVAHPDHKPGYAGHTRANVDHLREHYQYDSIEYLERAEMAALVGSDNYYGGSLDLGAGPWQTLIHVTLPLVKPGIVSGVLLTYILSIGSFLTPDLLGGTESMMIGNLIAQQFGASRDWAFGSALSFLLMYATFIILWIRTIKARDDEATGI